MRATSAILALVASLPALAAASAPLGFNYGSTDSSQAPMTQASFERLFSAASKLSVGAGQLSFTSARLYTMIQAGTASNYISAIDAAVSTGTHLLLGMWASQDQNGFNNEIAALKAAIAKYPNLKSQIDGLSVGSEDLYRITPTGIASKAGTGQQPDILVSYLKQVRDIIDASSWSGIPIGHVDTWTAWVIGSNIAVAQSSDFLGVDAYPYFQNTEDNSIDKEPALFQEAMGNTQGVASQAANLNQANKSNIKPEVWITETGFPVSGKTENNAVPGTDSAKKYWDSVGCPAFGVTPTWWYTVDDTQGSVPNPSFGIVSDSDLSTPLFDISCANVSVASSSTVASSQTSTTAASSGATTLASSTYGSGTTAASSAPTVTSTGVSSGPVSESGSGSSSGINPTATSGSSPTGGSSPTSSSPTGATAVGPSPSVTSSIATAGAGALQSSFLLVAGAAVAAGVAFL